MIRESRTDFTIRKSHKKRNSRITNMKFLFFRYIHNTSLKHKVTIQYWSKKFPVSCCAACAIFSSSIFLFDWKITGPDKIYQARLLALSQYRLFFLLSDLSHEAVSSRSVSMSRVVFLVVSEGLEMILLTLTSRHYFTPVIRRDRTTSISVRL